MKQCKQGYYYCNTDKKCKRIPLGYRVASSGYLRKENGDDQTDSDNDNGETTNGDGGGMSEGSLFNWFQGSKSKSKKGKKGKPGWVNVLTGGTCASDEPGEGVPKCVSRSKYDSMTKAERKSAARRKKTADSGQQEKSGAEKPTYVSTDKPKKKMKKEELEIIEANDKKGKGSGKKDACYKKVKSRYSVWPSAYASGALVKCRKVGAANWGNKSESVEFSNWRDDFQATEYEFIDIIKAEPLVAEASFEINPQKHREEVRKKKIRNRTETGDEGSKIAKQKVKGPKLMGEDKYSDLSKNAARMSLLNNPSPRSTPEKSAAQKKLLEKKHGMKLDDHPQFKKEEVEEGYRVVSTSFKSGDGNPNDDVTIKKQKSVVSGDNLTMDGAKRSANKRRQKYGTSDAFQVQKTRPAKKRPSNAASEAEVKAKIDKKEENQQKSRAQKSIDGMNREGTPSGKVAAARLKTDKKFNKEEVDNRRAPKELLDRLNSRMVGWMADDGPNERAYDAKQRLLKKAYEKRKRMEEEIETIDESGKKCWKGYKKKGIQKLFGKTYNRCVKANEEKEESKIGGGNLKTLTKKAVKRIDYDVDGDVDPNDKVEKKTGDYGEELPTPFGKFKTKIKKKEFSDWRDELEEGAAWTKKSGKNKSGGLNEKGRKSYERENPGSDLKAPSKKKGNKRRASFCARMKGMKKKLTSAKTARDPDSRINKSLRAWNCWYEKL